MAIMRRPGRPALAKLNPFSIAYPLIGFASALLTLDYAIEELDYDQAG